MSEDCEPEDSAAVRARNGDELDPAKARVELETAVASLYRERMKTVARSIVFPGAEDWSLRESAAQDAFTDLYERLRLDPGRWFEDAASVAIQDVLAEWTADARRLLSKSVNEDRRQYRAGAEASQLTADEPIAATSSERDESGAEFLGIDLGLARALFTPLSETEDELLLMTTLRWFTGSGLEEIAREARLLTGDDSIGAADVLVRLTRLLRQAPRGWIKLATHCGRVTANLPVTAQLTRPAELQLLVERNGWRDPFAPALKGKAVTLLMEWMRCNGKLEAKVSRDSYEWTADERRHLAARRIATGFATSLRTLQRAGQHAREELQDGDGPLPGIWAPSETFGAIARDLPSARERNSDAVRRYFDRMLKEPENGWLHYLLPWSSPPGPLAALA